MNRADSHLDVAGYLTDDLHGPDRGTARRHIAACLSCRDEVLALQPLVHHVAATAPAYAVPTGLEARTLRVVRSVAAPRRRYPRFPLGRPGRHGLLIAAAVAALLGGVGITGLALGSGDTEEPYAAQLHAPGPGTLADQADQGRIVLTGTGDQWSVLVESSALRPLPGSSYYELWFVADRQPYSAGRLTVDTSGRSALPLSRTIDPAVASTVIITAEPADGDPLPTGREVLRGTLSR